MQLKRSCIGLLVIFVLGGLGCQQSQGSDGDILTIPDKPNILWLVTEDMGPYIPPFGDSTIQTPNLSRLASEGVRYLNFYSTSGVCAPSRAAIATGMYPSGIGANHMRTNSYAKERGMPPYEAVPPAEVKMVSELLRRQGYYCTNNYKTDYQFRPPVTAWDESSPYAHWRNRAENQPFFAVFNFTETHESGLFEPYGHRHIETRHYLAGDRSYEWQDGRMTEEATNKHIPKDLGFPIPPYLPNNEVVRRDMWKMYNNIAEMDQQLGAVLQQLEDDGLLEHTVIFFYGDHGGPLPRQKRLIYESGLKTPLIIRYPGQQKAGTIDDQLLSFIDLAPTLVSITGQAPPKYMDGKAFLGPFADPGGRQYIHAAADRFDAETDVIRAVKDNRYKYIRNYRPEQGYYLPITYRERIPTMQELLRLQQEGKLNEVQAQWFRKSKPNEELYDCQVDRHELNNLATDPAYQQKLAELRSEMDRWITEIGDEPNLPEKDLLKKLWAGEEMQPVTANPEVNLTEGTITLTCDTEGASLGYKLIEADGKAPHSWKIYTEPLAAPAGGELWVVAHRLGYVPSEQLKIDF